MNTGCRFTGINAPLTTFLDAEDPDLCHCCFAVRIYHAISNTRVLPQQDRISPDVVINCQGGNQPCIEEVVSSPAPSPPATPPLSAQRIDRLHPCSPLSNVRVLPMLSKWQISKIIQDDENSARRTRQRIHGPEDPTLPPLVVSSSSDEDIHSIVPSWKTCLQVFADACTIDHEMFIIHGDSLDCISHGFLLFLHHLSHITLSNNHCTWELPEGVSECGPLDFRSLLK